jgi:LysR family transcriptional regulator, glycine cleavage system transcriptional activator
VPPSTPSLIALRAFESIGRLGGIRRAAAALGVSHAIVSRHLKAVEELVAVPLFDREAGRLTRVGEEYHARISAAFSEIASATAALTASRADRLVIGCAPGLALLWLTERLARFGGGSFKDAPIVELRSLDTAPDPAADQVDGDIRYQYGHDRDRGRDYRSIELGRPPVFPVAAPALVAALKKRPLIPADLIALSLIEEGDGSDWKLWLAAKGIEQSPVKVVAHYGHAHLALAAARAGQGIALGNRNLLGDDLVSGRLVALEPGNPAFAAVPLGAYVFRAHRSRWSEPALARFRRWLLAEFDA